MYRQILAQYKPSVVKTWLLISVAHTRTYVHLCFPRDIQVRTHAFYVGVDEVRSTSQHIVVRVSK